MYAYTSDCNESYLYLVCLWWQRRGGGAEVTEQPCQAIWTGPFQELCIHVCELLAIHQSSWLGCSFHLSLPTSSLRSLSLALFSSRTLPATPPPSLRTQSTKATRNLRGYLSNDRGVRRVIWIFIQCIHRSSFVQNTEEGN